MTTQPLGNNESNNEFLNRKQQIVLNLLKEHKQSAESMNAFITFEAMQKHSVEFARFLLKNAMLNTRGKLYLKLTDAEIEQIIENAIKEFENGSDTKSTV